MGLFEDNEKLKLAKAVLNHTKTVANDYIEKHAKSDLSVNGINIDENKIYERVMIEIEENNKVKSTLAKALEQSEGDDKKIQSLYIKLRVAELIQEEKEQISEYLRKKEEYRICEEIKQQKMEERKLQHIEKIEEVNKKIIESESDKTLKIENENFEKKMRIFSLIFIICIIVLYVLKNN